MQRENTEGEPLSSINSVENVQRNPISVTRVSQRRNWEPGIGRKKKEGTIRIPVQLNELKITWWRSRNGPWRVVSVVFRRAAAALRGSERERVSLGTCPLWLVFEETSCTALSAANNVWHAAGAQYEPRKGDGHAHARGTCKAFASFRSHRPRHHDKYSQPVRG